MPRRSRTAEISCSESIGLSKKASAPACRARSRESSADTATTGSRRCCRAAVHRPSPAPPEIEKVDHHQAQRHFVEQLPGLVRGQGSPHGVALGAQEVLGDLGRVGVSLRQQDGRGGILLRMEVQWVTAPLFQEPVGLGRLAAPRDLGDDKTQRIDLRPAVEPLATFAPFGDDPPVSDLPAPKRLGGHTQHLADRPDAVDPSGGAGHAVRG